MQGLIYIACMLFYFKVAPYELIFDLWIPLDFFIFLSMTAYAIICHQENKRREEHYEKLKESLKNRVKLAVF